MSTSSSARSFVEEYLFKIKAISDNIISSRKLDGTDLINVLEDLEMDINMTQSDYTGDHAIFHIIGYLLNWDSINLRFLWKRLPALPHSKTVYNIEKMIWKKEYNKIIPAIKEALVIFADQRTIHSLLTLVEERASQELLKFLCENFTCIKLTEFAEIFCLSTENAHKLILENNWKVTEDGFVEIDYTIADKNMLDDLAKRQLDQITEMVGFMESLI